MATSLHWVVMLQKVHTKTFQPTKSRVLDYSFHGTLSVAHDIQFLFLGSGFYHKRSYEITSLVADSIATCRIASRPRFLWRPGITKSVLARNGFGTPRSELASQYSLYTLHLSYSM